jgi:hypothetical protein
MVPLTKTQEQNIKTLALDGNIPTEISKKLNIGISTVGRRMKEWGIFSPKQASMKRQSELRKKGKRWCHVCKETFPMTKKFFGVSKGVWRRRCKPCDSRAANKQHHERMKNLDLTGAIRYKFYQAKYRSKQKKYEFNLSIEEIKVLWEKQNGKCFYTGIEMVTLPNHYNYFSMDRYDSSKGYTSGNIVLCCHVINIMKKDMSEEDFIKYCRAVVDYKTQQPSCHIPQDTTH